MNGDLSKKEIDDTENKDDTYVTDETDTIITESTKKYRKYRN